MAAPAVKLTSLVRSQPDALARAAAYGTQYRKSDAPLDPEADAQALRKLFCVPLPEGSRCGSEVIDDLIAAAEPGLVGNRQSGFFAWVMGGSDDTGVAADWLTSVWGQNAGIYQTAPAAAIAEEAVSAWLLDLLDLPREGSVGFVTGATMAGFVGLAAARLAVLERAGHDFEQLGLQGAPHVSIFFGEDTHICNMTALRYLGFGEANFVRIRCDLQGVMDVADLAEAMAAATGPKIVIAQAGQINTGGFDAFTTVADLVETHEAWLHIDGAFGLWARTLREKDALTEGLERADSWSVDGHKWLQLPYDSGFAILRDAEMHRRAMSISASYLNRDPDDGRNPSEYNPELSRRARGFAAWAVLQGLGRRGVETLIRKHCTAAEHIAGRLAAVPGIEVANRVDLNQVTLRFAGEEEGSAQSDTLPERVAILVNETGTAFLKPAEWKGRPVLRISVISQSTDISEVERLIDCITTAYRKTLEGAPG